jgi:hypothetical protein
MQTLKKSSMAVIVAMALLGGAVVALPVTAGDVSDQNYDRSSDVRTTGQSADKINSRDMGEAAGGGETSTKMAPMDGTTQNPTEGSDPGLAHDKHGEKVQNQ